MKLPRRQFLHLAAGAAALPALPRIATAQAFPSRPITMVVPVPAGGAMDTNARLVAEGMRDALGQPVVIENITGASGSIGAGRVARATPDGYTLVYGANVTHVLNAAVYNLNYDVVTDFEPIALIGSTPWLVAAKKDFPAERSARHDRLAEGQSGQGVVRHRGARQPVAYRRRPVPEGHRHALSADSLQGHRAVDPGPGLGQSRHGDPRSDHLAAAVPRRPHQDLRGDDEPAARRPRRTSRPSTRPARPVCTWSPGRRCSRPRVRRRT